MTSDTDNSPIHNGDDAAKHLESLNGEVTLLKQSIYEYKKISNNAEVDESHASLVEDLEAIAQKLDSLPKKWRGGDTTENS